MGKVKQAIQEVEEEVLSLVKDIPQRYVEKNSINLKAIQEVLPERLKDNPYANDKELIKKYYKKAVWERDNEEEYHEQE